MRIYFSAHTRLTLKENREYCNSTGGTQAALSQIESGEHKARKATREKRARAMGITPEQLK